MRLFPKLHFIITGAAVLSIALSLSVSGAKPVKALIITGGHSYDTLSFTNMFRNMKGISAEQALQPRANLKLVTTLGDGYDVLIFYDMWKTISEPEKMAYLEMADMGKPMLFLHHSLAAYQNWPEFESIIGGKYLEKGTGPAENFSTYQHNEWVDIELADKHPITKGLKEFRIFDEVYGNTRVLKNVKPILKTNHPQSSRVIAWENHFKNSTIIYIQPGHDHHAFTNKEYIRLVRASIFYLAKTSLKSIK